MIVCDRFLLTYENQNESVALFFAYPVSNLELTSRCDVQFLLGIRLGTFHLLRLHLYIVCVFGKYYPTGLGPKKNVNKNVKSSNTMTTR